MSNRGEGFVSAGPTLETTMDEAFVRTNADTVRPQAQSQLAAIEAYRDAHWANRIAKRRKQSENSLIRKLLRRKPLDAKGAERALAEQGAWRDREYWGTADALGEILTLASMGGDIYLSPKHVNALKLSIIEWKP